MNKIYLISEESIKKHTLVNDNVDVCYIAPAIDVAQEVDLNTAIGDKLLTKLKTLVGDNSIFEVENEKYKVLLDEYVTPYLCWLVMSSVQIAINYKMTNSGVIENYDENKNRLDYKNSQALQSQYEKYANAYGNKLKNFIVKNINDYPEYREAINYEFEEDLQLCNIFLPSDGNKCDYKYK